MIFRCSIFFLLLMGALIGKAQYIESDTTSQWIRVDCHDNAILLPMAGATMIAGGLTHILEEGETLNHYVRNTVQQWKSEHGPLEGSHLHFDNYIQFLPAATPWILKKAGVPTRSSYRDLLWIEIESFAIFNIVVQSVKYTTRVPRPSGWARNSFPSGHTATAFWGAEIARSEFRESAPWVGYSAYALAALTGLMRIYNDRHWLGDVIAGGGVGVASARMAYWVHPHIQRWLNPQPKPSTSYSYTPVLTSFN